MVCISKDGEIFHVLRSTGQPQSVTLPVMAAGKHFTVTATKQNHFRFEQDVIVTSGNQGTTESHILDLELFPNPTDGKVNLVVKEDLKGKAVVEVINLLGERLLTHELSQVRQGETVTFDLSMFGTGLYTIKLCTENGCCSKKLSVK